MPERPESSGLSRLTAAQDNVSGTSEANDKNPANFPFWHVPEPANNHVPESTDDDVPESEAAHVPEMGAGWRIEVTNNGIYWQWRKGSHDNRQSRKGGKFQVLSEERKQAYEQNKQQYHNRRQAKRSSRKRG